MGGYIAPEELLITAITNKRSQVTLERCMGSLESVFKSALKKERRLLAFLSSYEANYIKKGLIQFSHDYDVTITYQEQMPECINDVVLDEGNWDPASIIEKTAPKEVTIVTSDLVGLEKRVTSILDDLIGTYEGLFGWQASSMSFDKLTSDVVCKLSYTYITSAQELRQMQSKTKFAVKNIWRTILGRAQVPQFIKPFLAVSYIAQECIYDQRAYDEVEADPTKLPTDPIPHLAYGPLVEKRGICDGLAWAFKRLMDEAGIDCIYVTGFLKDDLKVGHAWDLVKLDGQYYHVDPTWGIKDDGVYINGLLQSDSVMKHTHIWDSSKYPAAKGMRFSYEYIEDYLVENGTDFLDAGSAEKYMFPDDIVE